MMQTELDLTSPLLRPAGTAREIRAGYRKARRRFRDTLAMLAVDWPNAISIMSKLSEYVTDAIPSRDPLSGKATVPEPALYHAFDKGVQAYAGSLREIDPMRLLRFSDAALSEMARQIAGIAVSSADQRVWTPILGEPLSEWLEGKDAGTISITYQPGEASMSATQDALANYALTELDRRILKKVQHGC
ncbi:hypothetical protein [Azospirillum sp. SYSU D00513]|uniref:hypothetical protein n=1 Tax=Azospirillum sp. SYSU D00513 TaxID=2812561 RepID=UPI001A9594CB|nr:hypothetical protein [Azospirillum sp. SYSU D00513]